MNLDKLPRWALITIASVGLGSTWLLISTARADLDRFKGIAYQAKNTSEANTQSIQELKEAISDIRDSQGDFEKKYDRNQEENQRVFRQILAAVKS